jgi:hypothetical protein
MYDPRPTPNERPSRRVGGSERRANFVAHMDVVVGDEGTAALAEEGAGAHRLSSELQGVARDNTAGDSRRFAHVRWRHATITVTLLLLFVAGLVWIVDNVAGYSQRPTQQESAVIRHDGLTASATLPQARNVTVDCFSSGKREAVWKASAPASWLVAYRCGDSPLAAEIPGPASASAAAVAFLSALALLLLLSRWRRKNAWY